MKDREDKAKLLKQTKISKTAKRNSKALMLDINMSEAGCKIPAAAPNLDSSKIFNWALLFPDDKPAPTPMEVSVDPTLPVCIAASQITTPKDPITNVPTMDPIEKVVGWDSGHQTDQHENKSQDYKPLSWLVMMGLGVRKLR